MLQKCHKDKIFVNKLLYKDHNQVLEQKQVDLSIRDATRVQIFPICYKFKKITKVSPKVFNFSGNAFEIFILVITA